MAPPRRYAVGFISPLLNKSGINQIDVVAINAIAVIVYNDSHRRLVRCAIKSSIDVPQAICACQHG